MTSVDVPAVGSVDVPAAGSVDVRALAWPHPGPNRLLLAALIGAAAVIGGAASISPVLGAGAAVAVAGGILVVLRPALGAYTLVAVVPVTSGFQTGMPIPQVRLSEALIAGIGVPVLVAARRRGRRWSSFDTMILLWAAAWTVLGTLDTVGSGTSLTFTAFGTLIGPFQFILLYRAVATCLVTPHQRQVAGAVLVTGSVPVSLLAVAQQVRVPGINAFIGRLTGGDVFSSYGYSYLARATGPFDHWTPLAGYLLVVMLFGIALLLRGDSLMPPLWLRLILILDAAGLLLSAELSAMAGLLVGTLVLGHRYQRGRDVARWILAGAVILGASFGSYLVHRLATEFGAVVGSSRITWVPQTISYRWTVWTTQYLPAVGERLISGWGTVLPRTITWPFTESQYVSLLMEGGMPVLSLFLAMMAALFALARRSARLLPVPEDAAAASSLEILVLVVLVISSVFPYFTSGGLPEPLFVLVGLVVSARAGQPLSAGRPLPSGAGRAVPHHRAPTPSGTATTARNTQIGDPTLYQDPSPW